MSPSSPADRQRPTSEPFIGVALVLAWLLASDPAMASAIRSGRLALNELCVNRR